MRRMRCRDRPQSCCKSWLVFSPAAITTESRGIRRYTDQSQRPLPPTLGGKISLRSKMAMVLGRLEEFRVEPAIRFHETLCGKPIFGCAARVSGAGPPVRAQLIETLGERLPIRHADDAGLFFVDKIRQSHFGRHYQRPPTRKTFQQRIGHWLAVLDVTESCDGGVCPLVLLSHVQATSHDDFDISQS